MYYYIRGSLELLESNIAVIEAAGVGYCLSISANTRSKLAALNDAQKKNVKLLTHLAVREDGVELFGFYTDEELNVFRLLISVSGIGPKVALSVLGAMTPERLAIAISQDDKKTIAKAPGIGPKTAARIILELKDKLRAESTEENDDGGIILPAAAETKGAMSDAIDALTVLGYSRSAASEAVRGIPANLELEDIIREALKKLLR